MKRSRRYALTLAFLWLGCSLVLAAGGWLYVSHQRADARAAAYRELGAIADLKLSQITNWREERLSDARFFAHARFVAEDAKRFVGDPQSETNRSAVLQWLLLLKGDERYYGVVMFNARGERMLALPDTAAEPPEPLQGLLERVGQTRNPVITDLHRDNTNGLIHLDILWPIYEGADSRRALLAAVLMKLDARHFLFPLIQSWPTPSRTAETLLVRPEGQEAVYLNDLRFRRGAAFNLRLPLGDPALPAARVLRGETRAFEGTDYRGVPVVAVGRKVPGTGWSMVAKVDQQEIYAGLRQQTRAAVAVLGSLLTASGLLVGMLWQQRTAQFHKLEAAGREAHALEMEGLNRLYAVQSQVNMAVLRADSREGLNREVCRVLVETGGFRMAWIGWVDEATAQVVPVEQCGDRAGYLQQIQVYALDRPEGRGPVGTAIRQGRACVFNDCLAEESFAPWREAAMRSGWRSLASFPIREEARVRGALTVYSEATNVFGQRELALLEEAAADLSFGMDVLLNNERRRLAEEQLRESEERFRTMADAMPQLAWIAKPDGNLFWYNRRWYEYTGATPEQMEGWGWQRVQDPEVLPEVLKQWRASLASGQPFEMELPLRGADGKFRPFLTRVLPLKDAQNRVLLWFGTNTDITEIVAARQSLARSREELERLVGQRTAQLVEANANLQTFAHSAAHDLRSPLRAILGFSGMALEGYGERLEAEGRSLLERVVQSAGQMARLLDDLLEYSKMSAAELRLQRMSLGEAVREALGLLEGEMRAKNAVVTMAEDLPEILGHPATVVVLMNNLIANGLKFTRPGVEPRIRVRAEPAVEPGFVRVWVEDNGIGVAAADQGKLFNAFQRLHGKQAYPGTGLGLAIVRKGAERMGGRVGVESEPGLGSRFWVELRVPGGEFSEIL